MSEQSRAALRWPPARDAALGLRSKTPPVSSAPAAVHKDMLQELFRPHGRVEIGRVKQLGAGLSRKAYVAEVALLSDPRGYSGAYTVLPPQGRGDPGLSARTGHEAQISRSTMRPFNCSSAPAIWPRAETAQNFSTGSKVSLSSTLASRASSRNSWRPDSIPRLLHTRGR